MKLKLPAIVPWMVLAGAAHGQVRSADVLYTFHEATPSPAYRLGDECFIALETAETWGWKTRKTGDSVEVKAEGHTIQLTTRYVSGKTAIPLRKALTLLGGKSDWTSGTDTLNVYSGLTEISVQDGKVHAEGPLAFKPKTFFLNPGRTVIDLDGARLGPETQQDVQSGVRVAQFRPNVVRIVIETAFVPRLPEESQPETQEFDLQVSRDPDVTEPTNPAPPTPKPRSVPTTQTKISLPIQLPQTTGPDEDSTFPTTVPPITPINNGATVTSVPTAPQLLTATVDNDTPTTTTISFHLPIAFQKQATIVKPDPDTVVVTLPGVSTVPLYGLPAPTTAIGNLSSRMVGPNTVITIELSRPMGTELTSNGTGFTLSLFKPKVGNGRLAGKVIVVDPGHGGHDRGAHVGLVNEKDLNLPIGLRLADKLAKAGATVIMTRQTDVFIPLMTRSIISNQNHADFFISCHINSTGGSHTQSGTITFHHQGNKVGLLLAQCIQDQIAKVNKLPNLGAWSDGRIYGEGFSVLRHTYAPCVLVEMGFINYAKDRERMLTDDFQDAVTTAIVKGVRVFLGDCKPNE